MHLGVKEWWHFACGFLLVSVKERVIGKKTKVAMTEWKMMLRSLAFLLLLVGVAGAFFSNVAGGIGGSLVAEEMARTETGVLASSWWTLSSWLASLSSSSMMSSNSLEETKAKDYDISSSQSSSSLSWWLLSSTPSSLFSSSSSAASTGAETLHNESKETTPCPLSCFRPNPVCGVDGITYWCGSVDAECAGVEVDYTGFCDFDSKGTGGKGILAIQSLLLVHMVWLMLAAFLVVLGIL